MSGPAFFLAVLALCGLSEVYLRLRCVRCWWRIRRHGVFCRHCSTPPAPREVLDRWPGEREIEALFREVGCSGEVET